MYFWPLAAFLVPALAMARGHGCDAGLPLNECHEMSALLTEEKFTALLRCPEDVYRCPENRTGSKSVTALACSCASSCGSYGDCCWEAPVDNRRYDNRKPRPACIAVDLLNADYGSVYMTNVCDKKWPQDNVSDGCESAEQHSDPFYFIPATSPTGVTYYNGFCALCNYDIDGITFWNATLSPRDSSVQLFVPESILSNAGVGIKECYGSGQYVDSCEGTRNDEWTRQCETYFAPVMNPTSEPRRVYKNVYCALCNSLEVPTLACAPVSERSSSRERLQKPLPSPFLTPIIARKDCAYGMGDVCYIYSTQYRYTAAMALNGSGANATPTESEAPYPLQYTAYMYFSVTSICISEFFLALKAVVYAVYKSSRCFASKCTLCLSCTLFCTDLISLADISAWNLPEAVCVAGSILMHYGYLASLIWTSVLIFDIWRGVATYKLSHGGSEGLFVRYCLVGWCLPLCLVLPCVVLDWAVPSSPVAPRYGREFCWINNLTADLIFWHAPEIVVIIVNCTLYACIVVHVRRTSRQAARFEGRSGRDWSHSRLFVTLAFLMGGMRILCLLNVIFDSVATAVLRILLTELCGVYLFFGLRDYRYIMASCRSHRLHSSWRRGTALGTAV